MKKYLSIIQAIALLCMAQSCSASNEDTLDEIKEDYSEATASEFNPIILDVLRNGSYGEKHYALHILNVKAKLKGHLYSDDLISEIDSILTSKDETMRHKASSAAIGLGKRAIPMKEHLMELVDLSAGGSAFFSAQALGNLGEDANSAQEVLARSLYNKKAKTREYSCVALRKIGPLKEEVLKAILPFLEDESSKVAINVAGTLILNDFEEEAARGTLAEALDSTSNYSNRWVIHVLSDMSKLSNLEPWAITLLTNFQARTNDVVLKDYALRTLSR